MSGFLNLWTTSRRYKNGASVTQYLCVNYSTSGVCLQQRHTHFPFGSHPQCVQITMLTRIAHTCSYLHLSTLTVVHITKITRIAPYDAFTTHTRFFFVYICVNRRWCTSRLQGLKSVTPFYTHTRFFVTSLSTLAVVCRGRKMKMCLCRRWGSQPHPDPLLKKKITRLSKDSVPHLA